MRRRAGSVQRRPVPEAGPYSRNWGARARAEGRAFRPTMNPRNTTTTIVSRKDILS